MGGVAVGAWVPLGLEPNASLCPCDVGAKKATDRIKIANDFMVDPLKSDKCTFAISNDLWTDCAAFDWLAKNQKIIGAG